jgi:hypothetical protein
MASILKVDTIQDQSGNNIINENADTITIGASGDTITIPSGATLTNNGTQTGLTLSDNILFNTASKGIYLGVTTATASNLLDDYEEGTWTPQYDNNTNNLAVTYDIQLGNYRKIGSVVFISGTLRTDSVTRSGVWIKLDNLPFAITTSATDSEIGGLNIHEATSFSTVHPSTGVCKVSVAGFILIQRSSANGNTIFLEDGDMATGTDSNKIAFSGFYLTD